MSAYEVRTPDGETHRHVDSAQTGTVEIRSLTDGTIQVLGVHATKDVRGWGGKIVRHASRTEEVLGTYPPGSTVEQIPR